MPWAGERLTDEDRHHSSICNDRGRGDCGCHLLAMAGQPPAGDTFGRTLVRSHRTAGTARARAFAPEQESRAPDALRSRGTDETDHSISFVRRRRTCLSMRSRQLLPALARRDVVAAARVADLFVDSPFRPANSQRHRASMDRPEPLACARLVPKPAATRTSAKPCWSKSSRVFRNRIPPRPSGFDNSCHRIRSTMRSSRISRSVGPRAILRACLAGPIRCRQARSATSSSRARHSFSRKAIPPKRRNWCWIACRPVKRRAEALISVVHQWAPQDFAAASAWVERIPEDLLRERATQELEAARRAQP